MTTKHTPAAVKLLADLDAELAASGAASGQRLSWTVRDEELRSILASTVDRRAHVAAVYQKATDPKRIVQLSNEIRQLDKAVGNLLKEIRTDVDAPESITTQKNRRAANIRWQREREREAG